MGLSLSIKMNRERLLEFAADDRNGAAASPKTLS
jgi:hypothetical protein